MQPDTISLESTWSQGLNINQHCIFLNLRFFFFKDYGASILLIALIYGGKIS